MKQIMKNRMMKTAALVILGVAMAGGSAVAADKWDGGDDLPTSPLACDAGPAAAAAAKPYDGGQTTGAPDKAGKPITLVDVPKLIGIGYFNATSKGMQDAAKEIGNVKVTTDGPTEAKIDEQIKFIDNYITRGVDGILFAANDPVAIAPVLKKALSKGIDVVGYDANSQPDARQWFINQAQFNGIAKAMVDAMAKEAGEDKGFAIVTSTFTTPNQARWIAEMSAYAAKCHPKLKWLETVEAQEDNVLSFNQATTLINKYGDKLSGPVRHDVGRHARLGRSRHQGGSVRQARRHRSRHAECDEALCQCRLRQVGRAVEPGRSRLCRDLCDPRRGRRQAETRRDLGRRRQARQAQRHQRQRNSVGFAVHLHQGQHQGFRFLIAVGAGLSWRRGRHRGRSSRLRSARG
jgi:ABC-type sugar transport system substrate-binding protein